MNPRRPSPSLASPRTTVRKMKYALRLAGIAGALLLAGCGDHSLGARGSCRTLLKLSHTRSDSLAALRSNYTGMSMQCVAFNPDAVEALSK